MIERSFDQTKDNTQSFLASVAKGTSLFFPPANDNETSHG